jgi:integrase
MIRKKKNQDGTVRFEARVKVAGQPLYQGFGNYQDAEIWVNEIRYRRNNNLPNFYKPVTLDEMFEAYKRFAIGKDRAESTLERHEYSFALAKAFYQNDDMVTVSIEEHELFLASLKKREKKTSNASINRVRSFLSALFSVAINKRLFGGVFKENPFRCIERLPEVIPSVEYWNKEEINRLIEAERGSFYYPMWVTWLNTGLRFGELAALNREQFDIHADTLTVDRTWCRVAKQIKRVTKGKKIRHVGLNTSIQSVLYPKLKDGLVFTKDDGSPLTHSFVYNYLLPKVCKKAGIKELGTHGFRKSYGAHYMMNGGSLWDLQKILGHSDINITEKHYAHFSRDHVQKRANVVNLGENVLQANFKRGVA